MTTDNQEYTLTIKGFKNKAQVKAFAEWYEGQGEQDASMWFGEMLSDGELDITFMPVNLSIPYVWDDSNMTIWLNI